MANIYEKTFNKLKRQAYAYAKDTSGHNRLETLTEFAIEHNHPHPIWSRDDAYGKQSYASMRAINAEFLDSICDLIAYNSDEVRASRFICEYAIDSIQRLIEQFERDNVEDCDLFVAACAHATGEDIDDILVHVNTYLLESYDFDYERAKRVIVALN